MRLAPRTLKTISGLLLCVCFFSCGGTLPRLGSLMTFEMEDQFRNSHSHADFKDRMLVVIGSDRGGASAAEKWGKALSHSLKPEMDSGKMSLVALADLEGVPFFLKDYVRGKFSQNAGDWALMDWKGLFADSYGFIAGNANVVVFDKEGVLAYQAHFSECRPDQVLSLTAIIRSKLDGPPPVECPQSVDARSVKAVPQLPSWQRVGGSSPSGRAPYLPGKSGNLALSTRGPRLGTTHGPILSTRPLPMQFSTMAHLPS